MEKRLTVQKMLPAPLPKRGGGAALTEDELLVRWQQIVLFHGYNGFYPNIQDLISMWSVSKQAALNTLDLLDKRHLIQLFRAKPGVQIGITEEQLRRGNGAGNARNDKGA